MAAEQAYQHYLEQLADYYAKEEAYKAAGKAPPKFSFQTPEAIIGGDITSQQFGTYTPISGDEPVMTPVADEFAALLATGGVEVMPYVAPEPESKGGLFGTGFLAPITEEEFNQLHPGGITEIGLGAAGLPAIAGLFGGGSWIQKATQIVGILAALGIGGVAVQKIADLLSGGASENEIISMFTGGQSTALTTTGGGSMTTGTQVTGGTLVNGVPFGGIGVPEPPKAMVLKAWKTKAFSHTKGEYWVYFWKLADGRVMCWNAAKNEAKIWRPKKNMVLGPNPRLPALLKFTKRANKMLLKLDKQADRVRRQFGQTRVVYSKKKR